MRRWRALVPILLLPAALLPGADEYPADRVRYDMERATVYFEAGRLTPAEMQRFAGLVDRGIGDIQAYLGADETPPGKITFYVSTRVPMSRAFRRTVLLPLERVRSDSAPYLHETTHVLLPSRSDCMWLGEGFASYAESYVSEHIGGYDGAVFSRGGNREIDGQARRYLATEDGRAVLPFVGECGSPPDVEWERARVAAPFYVLSQSFIKYMVGKAGLGWVKLAHASSDVPAAVEGSTGRALVRWKADWLASLDKRKTGD
jgi:hypothetical protein